MHKPDDVLLRYGNLRSVVNRRYVAIGSLVTAAFAVGPAPQAPASPVTASESETTPIGGREAMKTVYLAGPMVFFPAPENIFAEMKAILLRYNLKGVAPIDNQVSLKGVPPGEILSQKIYEADIALMKRLDAAIFNINPFRRGTEMDPGTAFEVGYCRALNRPMAGWTTDARSYPNKVRDYMKDVFKQDLSSTGANSQGATSGALRDPDGILVHSDGMYQNLMIQEAILTSGGSIGADPDWRVAFEQAAESLSKLVRLTPTPPPERG